MGIFRKDLEQEIDTLMHNFAKVPQNWDWLSRGTLQLEQTDVQIMQKLAQLHKRGKDVPELTNQILQLCTELKRLLEDSTPQHQQAREIIGHILQIYEQEHKQMSVPTVLIFDNPVTRKYVASIASDLKNPLWEGISNQIYRATVTRESWKNIDDKSLKQQEDPGGIYHKHHTTYKKIISQMREWAPQASMKTFDDAWFHIHTAPNIKKPSGFTQKIYYTVQINSIWETLIKLPQLALTLQSLSNQYQDNIKVKIPSRFFMFLMNSDIITVHYHKNEEKNAIVNECNQWISKNNIGIEPRQYNRVTHARDYIGTSFSDNVAESVVNFMKTKYGKVTNEQLAIMGLNKAFTLSASSLQQDP